MIYAARYNRNLAIIETLLKAGADVNVRDKDGKTPLMAAVRYNSQTRGQRASPEIIETLLKTGADINARDKDGGTALMEAAAHPDIQWLVVATIEAQSETHTQTHEWRESPEIIETLLAAGADINVRDNDDGTALMRAAANNSHPAIIETFLKAGASVQERDKKGRTAVYFAKKNKKIYKTKVYWKLNDELIRIAASKFQWAWISRGVRHNPLCRWYGKTRAGRGRYCLPTAGRACKQCGG